MKTPIYITGITIDGKPCLGGIFKTTDTYGFPLPMSMTEAESRGAVVSWPTFIKDAMRAGWSFEKAQKEIAAAFRENGRNVPKSLYKLTPSRCEGFGNPLDVEHVPALLKKGREVLLWMEQIKQQATARKDIS